MSISDVPVYYDSSKARKGDDHLYIDNSGQIFHRHNDTSQIRATIPKLREAVLRYRHRLMEAKAHKNSSRELLWRTVQLINIVNVRIESYNKKLAEKYTGLFGWFVRLFLKLDTVPDINHLAWTLHEQILDQAMERLFPEELRETLKEHSYGINSQ